MNGQHPPFRNHDIIFLDTTVNLQQIYSFVIIYTRTQRKEQEQEQQK